MGIYRNVWLKYEKIWIFPTSEKKGGPLFFEEDSLTKRFDKRFDKPF